jgi:hypothetical protein
VAQPSDIVVGGKIVSVKEGDWVRNELPEMAPDGFQMISGIYRNNVSHLIYSLARLKVPVITYNMVIDAHKKTFPDCDPSTRNNEVATAYAEMERGGSSFAPGYTRVLSPFAITLGEKRFWVKRGDWVRNDRTPHYIRQRIHKICSK